MTLGKNGEQKVILVVDDEPDILQVVEELFQGSVVHTAQDYETASQYLKSYTYDVVILDIMGVNGFELLKLSVARGFPTIMFTAHALTPEALKTSIKLGAVGYVPKNQINELPQLVDELFSRPKSSIWKKLINNLSKTFKASHGDDWAEKDAYLKQFIKELTSERTT